jgi:lipopolysaccharide/colanic/teichoic acid biosynthesis glycosyltransferase
MIVATEAHGSRPQSARRKTENRSGGFNFRPWSELSPPDTVIAPEVAPLCPAIGAAERVIALLLLIIASPLMLLIGIGVKLTSWGGPILYRQERVGLDRRRVAVPDPRFHGSGDRRKRTDVGQIFMIYKFRTMVPDAEKLTGPTWATEEDPRITKFGRLLRQLRLDELPQLYNVVQGTMCLIGPRPERPHFVRKLAHEIPEYLMRLRVPPGITGLAQVERKYDGTVDDVRKKLMYDLYYVRNKSPLLDTKILLTTIDVMLRGRGAR